MPKPTKILIAIVFFACLPITATVQAEGTKPPPHEETDSRPVSGEVTEVQADGILDKSLEIKGTGISLRFGGFAKVDYIQDFDPIGNEDQFKVNTIPVEGDPDAELGGSNNISARQTRFSVDVRSDTSDGMVRGYIEGDFFGSGNAFRLRMAYGEWKGLLGGQTWTTFQDIDARPGTLDYEGPDSEIFVRQAMIRYTGHPSTKLEWSVAVEDPNSQIAAPTGITGGGRSEYPDIPARFKWKPKWGHIQFAVMGRQLRFVSDGGVIDETEFGYGLNLTGKVNIGKHDAIMGQIAYGSGVGRYIDSFGGTNSDAVLTPTGELKALDTHAAVLGYTHDWSERLSSLFSGSIAVIDNEPSQPADAIKTARSVHVNLVYSPNRLLDIGGELMWGERENFDKAKGQATRLQVSIKYKFN